MFSTLNTLNDTDDALAELEILAQNQKKLNQLTSRMTGILSGFDQRLAGLEGTMIPIHHRTQTLQRVDKNIDATLEALKHTLGHFDVVEEEEPRILQGPDVHDVNPYFETIDRVVRGLEYLKRSDLKSQEGVVRRMHGLIETGSRGLTSLLQQWVAAESAPIDPMDYVPQRLPLPILSGATLEAIIPILSYLKGLPSNPSNGYAPFLAALSIYSDIRGEYLQHSIEPLGQRLVAYATERIGTQSSRAGGMAAAFEAQEDEGAYYRGAAGVRDWLKALLDMAENEHVILSSLLRGINPPSSNSTIASTFSRLLRPILKHFTATVTALHNHIRRSLDTHTLFAFDLIGNLSDLYARWETVIVKAAGKSNTTDDAPQQEGGAHALGEQLRSLRGTMIKVFPTFLNDIKSLPRQREGEVPSTTINEISYLGLAFIRQTCEYGDVVAPLLATLGAGNWMMSGNAAPVLSLSINQGEQSSLLSQYLCDTLSAVLSALDVRSKAIRQPSTASIFLLNNIGHLQRELTSTSLLQDYLGQAGTDLLLTAFRQARTGYLNAWHPVVAALMDDNIGLTSGKSGGSKLGAGVLGGGERAQKEDAKQRFAKFFEGLEDLERLHMAYPLSRDDDELRESLKREVLRLVLPLYTKFVAKQMAAHFSSNPSKHLRPESEVEERLIRLYT